VAVSVASGLWRQLRRQETVVWLVRAARTERLEQALRSALRELAEIDAGWQSVPGLHPGDRVGPSYVGDPIPVPVGWVLMVDFDSLPPTARREGVERFVARLEEAAAPDVELGPAPTMGNRYSTVLGFSPVVRALFRAPADPSTLRRGQPAALVDMSLRWLREMHAREDLYARAPELTALVISTELRVDWDALPSVLDAVLASGQQMMALSTDFTQAEASVTYGGYAQSGLALSASGASWDRATLAGHMRAQRDLIRGNTAALGWAGVVVDSNGQVIITAPTEPYDGPDPYLMWYQILTEEQLRYLGGVPAGGVVLPGGRAELTVGEPDQWIPGHPDHEAVRAQARELLTPSR
jgi:hypothetical protein